MIGWKDVSGMGVGVISVEAVSYLISCMACIIKFKGYGLGFTPCTSSLLRGYNNSSR